MRTLAWLVAAAGCYSPSLTSEVPCSAEGHCPGSQVCDFGRSPPTCVEELPDAGMVDVDAAPACVDSSQCPAMAPVCDDRQCRKCSADADCAGACSESAGTCIAEDAVLFVAPTGIDMGTCTRAAPCQTIGFALVQVTPMRAFIRLAAGTYAEQVKIEGATVTLSGEDADPAGVTISVQSMGPIIQLDAGGATLEGLTISGGTSAGISSKAPLTAYRVVVASNSQRGIDHEANDEAALVVRESQIIDNVQEGVSAQNGPATITRTYIAKNGRSGLVANRCALTMINTMVVNNGTPLGINPGVRLQNTNGRPQRFEHNTIANNVSSSGTAGIVCDQPVQLSSSILANNTFGAQMSGCTAEHTLFSSGAPNGMGNKDGDPAFVDATSGDFHITPGSDAIGRAATTLGVGEDFDGEPRLGTELDSGADELP